jgi:hypothetical protein
MTEPSVPHPNLFAPIHRALRTGILSGVCCCILMVGYSIHRYPKMVAQPTRTVAIFLSLFLVGVLWYGFAAVRWTRVTTPEDSLVLGYSARWGIAIGLVWTVEVVGGNVIMPHELGAGIGVLAAVVAAILPVVAGATGAARTGRIETGARIGFWSGMVSGLITFIALASVGLLVVNVSGFPGVETPRNVARALTANELAAFNLGDYLAGGVSHLVIVGGVFGGAAGAFGGIVGRALRSE